MSTNNNEEFAEVVKKIVINAPIDKVWNYVATAEGIGAWFMPNDMEPIEGKAFTLEAGPWGDSACKVTEVNAPNRLSFEWGDQWLITFELIAIADDQTEMTLFHAGWDETNKRNSVNHIQKYVHACPVGGMASFKN